MAGLYFGRPVKPGLTAGSEHWSEAEKSVEERTSRSRSGAKTAVFFPRLLSWLQPCSFQAETYFELQPELAGAGFASTMPELRILLRRADDAKARPGKGSAKSSEDGRGDAPPGFDGESDPENEELAQPSGPDGVPEDMATLVLDKSGLGPAMGQGAVLNTPSANRPINYAVDETSDAAVMLRVAAGDEAGFNYLVGKYHRAMINFLYRMVHNQAVAEELAQEVFLRVYRSRESYRAEAKFTTWLYRIATNLAVNHARDTKHERSVQNVYLDAPDEDSGTTPDVADDTPTIEQTLVRDERMAAIRGHVMALPERQRMAVLMHKYQGMDYRQIGDVLKLSESATKSLLFRAYQTLREKLKDFV
jgi:RNA polymerase sigma-70 factor (ECF subfamily)